MSGISICLMFIILETVSECDKEYYIDIYTDNNGADSHGFPYADNSSFESGSLLSLCT